MGNEILYAVVTSIVVGVVSGALGSYVAIKVLTNEIKWINRILARHDAELNKLHDRISNHTIVFHGENHNGKAPSSS